MDVPFRLVDVFTPRPLAGNQLCVVPEPVDLDHDRMLALAQEIGFSETTFVTASEADRYAMRIFTPGMELPFAGHPTLGTAFVMVSEGRVTSPATQVVAAGEIPVEVDVAVGTAWMTQLPASFGRVFEDRDLIATAIGLEVEDLAAELPVQPVSTGLPPTIVPIRDVETLRRAARNDRAIGRAIRGWEGRSSTSSPSTRRAAWSPGCSRRGSTSARTRRPVRRRDRWAPTSPSTVWPGCRDPS